MVSVHPRERGEHFCRWFRRNCTTGSSPRARGTRVQFHRNFSLRRFIPASAGNTASSSAGSTLKSVHPRERGEHAPTASWKPPASGSSPRARGTRPAAHAQLVQARFIPASAGNTRSAGPTSRPRAVHPRERGEHRNRRVPRLRQLGSSPRARGTPAGASRGRPEERFIPASAGNTGCPVRARVPHAVHPRERGEHFGSAVHRATKIGSSPRARGTPLRELVRQDAHRFIPASAGNTRATAAPDRRRPVHPRERGEHRYTAGSRPLLAGSSPRARGTRLQVRAGQAVVRFIPASAGNTAPPGSPPSARPVHPRERGEHIPRKVTGVKQNGSSPRARGTHPAHGHGGETERFIPASAGNTIFGVVVASIAAVHPRERGEHTNSNLMIFKDFPDLENSTELPSSFEINC